MKHFYQCFIPKVKKYFEEEALEFKVLLLIGNAPDHPESVCYDNENVEVVFLPPDTTSMLQPLGQGIIWFLKATYTCQVSDHIWPVIDADSNLHIMQHRKSLTNPNAITFIKAAVDEFKTETVNACWRNLWSEVMNDFKGFPSIMEKLGKSFAQQDKLAEKDLPTRLMKK